MTTEAQSRRGLPPVDTSWHRLGACTKADPELFFHPENETGSPKAARIAAAREVCEECPVLALCRAETLHERFGIWGGLSEDEREAIRAGKPTSKTPGLKVVPTAARLPTKGQGLDPGPVAAHVATLMEAGFNATSIARFCDLSPDVVRSIVKGKTHHIQHATAQKLLSVQVREFAA